MTAQQRHKRLVSVEQAVARLRQPMASPEMSDFLAGLSVDQLVACQKLLELRMQHAERQQRARRKPAGEGLL